MESFRQRNYPLLLDLRLSKEANIYLAHAFISNDRTPIIGHCLFHEIQNSYYYSTYIKANGYYSRIASIHVSILSISIYDQSKDLMFII